MRFSQRTLWATGIVTVVKPSRLKALPLLIAQLQRKLRSIYRPRLALDIAAYHASPELGITKSSTYPMTHRSANRAVKTHWLE